MNIICPKCGALLELPEELCKEGANFKCDCCAAMLKYIGGQILELKKSVSPRIQMPQQKRNGIMWHERNIPWWTRRWVKYAAIGIAALLTIILACFCIDLSGLSLKYYTWRRAYLAEKYGTDSAQYLKFELDMCRKILKGQTFERRQRIQQMEQDIEAAGYLIYQVQTSGPELLSLFVVNKYTGANGFMRKGITNEEFSYPLEISGIDAARIWWHYYFKTMIDYYETRAVEIRSRLSEIRGYRE